jgi:hypothetical protein
MRDLNYSWPVAGSGDVKVGGALVQVAMIHLLVRLWNLNCIA